MKALLLKDLYIVRQNIRYFLGLGAVYLFISFMMEDAAIGVGLFVVVSAVYSLSFFSYDDFAKWESYALTLPVTRRQIVSARYVAGLMMLGGGLVISLLLWGVLTLMPGNENPPVSTVLASLGGVSGAALLLLAIQFPLCYRFGVEKARISLALVFLIPFAVVTLGGRLGIPAPSEDTVILILRVATVAVLLLFWLSWRISCEFYEKREF